MISSLKILVKFPSRGRHIQFMSVIKRMVELSEDKDNIHYLITVDNDDVPMYRMDLELDILLENKYSIIRGTSKNKVDAINRDMEYSGDWDIVLLASDDMIPQVQGWDEVIRNSFDYKNLDILNEDHSIQRNLDQALWFFDGHQHRICTLVVMGRKRYERFNYLYHPSYISLWCDNEWTEVNQPVKSDVILFKHEHPAWGGSVPNDALYQRNEAYFERDKLNYMHRQQQGFPL